MKAEEGFRWSAVRVTFSVSTNTRMTASFSAIVRLIRDGLHHFELASTKISSSSAESSPGSDRRHEVSLQPR